MICRIKKKITNYQQQWKPEKLQEKNIDLVEVNISVESRHKTNVRGEKIRVKNENEYAADDLLCTWGTRSSQ